MVCVLGCCPGGANQLCLSDSQQSPAGYSDGAKHGALLYGTEYENTGTLDGNHNADAACAVCMVKTQDAAVYVQWGRSTSCSNGHTTEYTGLVMANKWTQRKSEFICVDPERTLHDTSTNIDDNGNLLYTTEAEDRAMPNTKCVSSFTAP